MPSSPKEPGISISLPLTTSSPTFGRHHGQAIVAARLRTLLLHQHLHPPAPHHPATTPLRRRAWRARPDRCLVPRATCCCSLPLRCSSPRLHFLCFSSSSPNPAIALLLLSMLLLLLLLASPCCCCLNLPLLLQSPRCSYSLSLLVFLY
ncbi:hypothetical protein VPH35_028727 [Triticum aestivum]